MRPLPWLGFMLSKVLPSFKVPLPLPLSLAPPPAADCARVEGQGGLLGLRLPQRVEGPHGRGERTASVHLGVTCL